MRSVDDSVARKMEEICPGRVRSRFDLGKQSWWRIGGTVRLLVEPSSLAELSALRAAIREEGVSSLFIGEMSNLLIADGPIDAVAIRLGASFRAVKQLTPTTVSVESGAWVPGVARLLQRQGLSGLEHTCGIPGTLGGLVMMNGGSLRQAIGTNIVSVASIDAAGKIVHRPREDCEFSYRNSIFARLDEVISKVELRLEPGDPVASRRRMHSILRARRLKFPRKLPNCGSVFKSDPASYADFGPPGAMIERAGWKGVSRGGAQVSPLHANFIVNRGAAKAADVLSLIGEIQHSVEANCGHRMQPEVRYVDRNGRIWPADQAYRRLVSGELVR